MTPPLLTRFPLTKGSHPNRDGGMCAMELAAWLAGEAHSDGPQCTCDVIAAYVRALNDFLPSDAARHEYLRPLVPRLVGTSGRADLRAVRGFALADATARVFAPMALHNARAEDAASQMQRLHPVVDGATAAIAAQTLNSVADASTAHAAQWLLHRAADGCDPVIWAAAAARAARETRDPQVWPRAVALLERLLTARAPIQSAAGGPALASSSAANS